jgi:methionyl aminopeptidase
MHEPPQIPNFRMDESSAQIKIKPGMVLAIEPMVNVGSCEVEILEDGWTAVTRDRSLSAHFEHSVAATEDGPLVLSG